MPSALTANEKNNEEIIVSRKAIMRYEMEVQVKQEVPMEDNSFQVIEGTNRRNSIGKKKTAYRVVKRIMDTLCSALALIVLLPVFLITAVAIWIEDGEPVIYQQERAGKNEKIYQMYKFRSMKKNAAEIHEELRRQYQNEEVSFKLKEDPRVTRVGKIIRRTNIDELPQLINILKGEMSIVGPRPLPVYEWKEECRRYGTKYSGRYKVLPGLTCYWQISNRSEIGFEERMQMDVDYSNDCCMWLDIKLIWKTVAAVLRGKAEY